MPSSEPGPEPGGEQDGGGDEPDYRFSLANERTFLAWIRTALGLLAGGIAVDQLTPDVAPAPLRIALAVVCALGGALIGVTAYRRWARVEAAMREGLHCHGRRSCWCSRWGWRWWPRCSVV